MALLEYEVVIDKPQKALDFNDDLVEISPLTTARLFAKDENELKIKLDKFYSGYKVIFSRIVDKY